MAVESLPLPLAALPSMPTRALMAGKSSPERYRAAIAIAAASVFVTGIGTVYLDAQANTVAAPAISIAGPVSAAAPAQAVAVPAPGHDAGPLRRYGAGTATDVSESVFGPIVSSSNGQSSSAHWQSVARARSSAVATTSSGGRVYAGSGTSSASSTSTASTSSSSSQYLVRSGDDFGAIGARLGISPNRVAALNPGVNPTQLQIGQSLHIG